jgi:hypothetical protein
VHVGAGLALVKFDVLHLFLVLDSLQELVADDGGKLRSTSIKKFEALNKKVGQSVRLYPDHDLDSGKRPRLFSCTHSESCRTLWRPGCGTRCQEHRVPPLKLLIQAVVHETLDVHRRRLAYAPNAVKLT